ncbi:3-methyladenine DNA glycosylase [Corynebacterium mendelii]|uniref:3-methyladenine DNA glycosylase n=1 Tax=Corynebacterium mendelii TaxID=2765362 RepID=A0A939DZ88_9CORY|nr:3-methyladenine DNA glycosylase [Corynebacterium mendelii]MBN9643560.1 3-methyladenine DNA glycosylase [Corynebacterium mendelii]
MSSRPPTLLPAPVWRRLANDHADRTRLLVGDHITRRSRGQKHPVWDFLFDYYMVSPAKLANWHPGVDRGLEGEPPHKKWKGYTTVTVDGTPAVAVDRDGERRRHGSELAAIGRLLAATVDNPAHFNCFGLHEWAMVYRQKTHRHPLPLRLGQEGTDAVVDSHDLKCTHIDAYRFFTPPAKPLNLHVITRDSQPEFEQCGCLHATMDLFKWAKKMGPLVDGELLLDCFELAKDARVLDMEASPYDCRELGFGVVAVETAEGKRQYVNRQRELAQRAAPLRSRLLGIVEAVM